MPSQLPISNAANLPQVELWNLREDVINLAPIEFTLAPGASADQYELHKYNPRLFQATLFKNSPTPQTLPMCPKISPPKHPFF